MELQLRMGQLAGSFAYPIAMHAKSEADRELIEAVDAYSSTKSKEAWPHVLEEMADVINVIDQFAGYTEAWPLIEAIRDRKIKRQLKRMAKEEACRKNDGPL